MKVVGYVLGGILLALCLFLIVKNVIDIVTFIKNKNKQPKDDEIDKEDN